MLYKLSTDSLQPVHVLLLLYLYGWLCRMIVTAGCSDTAMYSRMRCMSVCVEVAISPFHLVSSYSIAPCCFQALMAFDNAHLGTPYKRLETVDGMPVMHEESTEQPGTDSSLTSAHPS